MAVKEFFMGQFCERDATTSAVTVGSRGSRETVEMARRKFVKEAQTIAALDNRHVIRIHDIFEGNGTAYYVMEYLPGGSLADLVKARGVLPEEEAVGYARQVADALEYIHGRSVLHLDIKPGNLLFREGGELVLIDFGVSKHYDEGGVETTESPVARSRGYAPIEQYQGGGTRQFAPSTDLYSLGAVLYYMLTGSRPPEATEIIEGALTYPGHVSPAMRAVIGKAMAPRRGDRYQSAGEFRQALINRGHVVSGDEATEMDVADGATPPEAAVISSGTLRSGSGSGKKDPGRRNMALLAGVVVILALLAYGILSVSSEQPVASSVSGQSAVSSVSIGQPAAPGKTGRAGAANAINGHGYVDLGLSVKWATCNVGANKPEEYGNYYAWGETRTKSSYDVDNCETWEEDIGDIGGTSRDVAHVKWGSSWRMPTLKEFQELIDNCDWEWTTLDGVSGYRVTGKNGNSIFLPAAGWRDGTSLKYAGEFGNFWSSTPRGGGTQYAYDLYFDSGDHDWGWDYRNNGLSVRPVSEF